MSESEFRFPDNEAADLTGTTVGRFRIDARVGSGGMGEVYRAQDTQLQRTVAIKRLSGRARDEGAYKNELLREAQRASALNHPRIASVYDVFSEGNELFLVMEYVEGQTLKERLNSPIGISEFFDIAIQCLDAMAAAHENGILHGDLKPANIMLTRGRNEVKVCDFGLARRILRGVTSTASTRRAGIAGTPAYMPPEVVLEQPLDFSADIFSLGVVFYEMLAGSNPFQADTMIATIDRIRNHVPETLHRVNPSVSPALAEVVARMIAKNPAQRHATAAAALNDISRIKASLIEIPVPGKVRSDKRKTRTLVLAASLALLLVAGVVGLWNSRPDSPSPATVAPKMNLAVLPFAAAGAAPDRAFFTQGLTEALNGQLARLTLNRNFQVAPASDVRSRGIKNATDARQQLGAGAVLTGSVRFSGDTVVIDCALIDTRSGDTIRKETITANASDSIAVQDRVVEAAVRMIGIDLSRDDRLAISGHHTQQPSAYDFYLQGKGYLINFDRLENIDNAITLFRRALEIDPRYAPAYAGLGQAFWQKNEFTKSANLVEPARAACEGALAIDPRLADGHGCLGMVLNGIGQNDKAAEQFATALKLEPTNDIFYIGLAAAYEKLSRPADAEQTYKRAIDARPHYWAAYNTLGGYYYRLGRHDDAIAMYRQVVDLVPDSFRGYSNLGAAYFMKSQTAEAIAAFERSLAIRPNYQAASNLGTLYYFEGQYRRSAEAFRQALKLNEANYQVWVNLADALQWAGDPDGSRQTYKRARELAAERARVNARDAAIQMALASSEAALGEKQNALASLDKAISLEPDDAHTLFQIAVFLEYRAGRRDEALTWLSKAVARGQTWTEIDRAPALRELRKDPRFQKLRQ